MTKSAQKYDQHPTNSLQLRDSLFETVIQGFLETQSTESEGIRTQKLIPSGKTSIVLYTGKQ